MTNDKQNTLNNIKKRAEYLEKIRQYFKDLGVLEVDTPLAYNYAVTDPFIDLFAIDTLEGKRYLQSSPEYAMKRLLSELDGNSIYQICKAFRDEPCGKLHHHEFTLVEWYRVGINYFQLMSEMESLFLSIKADVKFVYLSYREVFEKYYGFDPHTLPFNELITKVEKYIGKITGLETPTVADCLDILFSYKIEKNLNTEKTVYFIYDYTVYQSALARKLTDDTGQLVAARFEVFYRGIELANGYYELIDNLEQKRRFEKDLLIRKQQRKSTLAIDEELLGCLANMPKCSGVALGFDRLLMSLENLADIKEYIIFE